MKLFVSRSIFLIVPLLVASCQTQPGNQSASQATATPSPVASPNASPTDVSSTNTPAVTLPVLDAFFADSSFPETLKSRLQLSDEQVTKLKDLAHAATANLDEASAGATAGESADARSRAQEEITRVIGADKTRQLATLVQEQWNGTDTSSTPGTASTAPTTNPTTAQEFAALKPNTVPTDSRIVVNAPAFRMDAFANGQLIKSYKIGIGYPQFPLPTALRKARTIIFNPTWTPPDEPWVAKMKDVAVGEKVEAGSNLNPLGPIKIPIGLPSLIHGGKPQAKIGTFASHGCVGLTTPQVRDFAKLLAQLGDARLSDADLARYDSDKTQTKQLKLAKDVFVELRYETIVVEDGKLHIYRDVYDQGTNTQEELEAVLETYGVKLTDLTEAERDQVLDALNQMAGKSTPKAPRPTATATPSSPSPSPSPSPVALGKDKKSVAKKAAPSKKNQKEIVIEIAALSGKGYPAPVDLDTGNGRPVKTKVAAVKPIAVKPK